MRFLFRTDPRLLTGMYDGKTTYAIPVETVEEQFYEYPRWTRWCFHLSIAIVCKFVDEKLESIGA